MVDGSLILETRIENSGFERDAKSLNAAASVMVGNITANIISGISSAAAQIPKQILAVGSSFEASMSQVAATMGITAAAAEFDALSEAAKEMGANTQFSASQAAEALNYLALAGYDANKSVSALPTVLNVAAAGGMELAQASDMITDAMSALGLGTDEMEEFADRLAVTAQKSNTSVSQLGQAILTVGGTAKTLSGGVAEMNTALGILADNGIKGAEGGTALRNVILSLSAPTDNAAAALKKLGVSAFDTQGNMRPLEDVFLDLNAALSSLTQQERTETLSEIFNKVDLKSVNALLGTSAERFDELGGYISDCTGAAEQMAETMNDNLKGDMIIMQSALEGLGTAAYEKFQQPMRTAVQGVTDDISLLAASLINGELSEGFSKISAGLSEMVSAASKLLANDILPALINGFAWLADNGEIIVPAISAAAAALVTYKVSISAAAKATEIATAVTAKGLTSIISLNPVGLLSAIGAAAATAALAFKNYVDNMATAAAVDPWHDVAQKDIAALKDEKQAFDELVESQKKRRAEDEAQADNIQKLWGELQNYVDETGKVISNNERANEIIGLLNGNYKMNIGYIDGQIQGYSELAQSMDGYIEKLRTESKIRSGQAAYDEAIKKQNEYIERRAELEEKLNTKIKAFQAAPDNDVKGVFAVQIGALREELALIDGAMNDYQQTIDEYEALFSKDIEIKIDGGAGDNIGGEFSDPMAEKSEKLRETWKQLDHDYAMGVVTSDKELYQKRLKLLEKYGNEADEEHWGFFEKKAAQEKDFAAAETAAAQKAAEEKKQAAEKAIQDEWDGIARREQLGLLTEQQALNERKDFFKKYYADFDPERDYLDESYEYYKKIYDSENELTKKALNEQEKTVNDGLTDILKRYREVFDELEKRRENYRNKLLSVGGDVFSVDVSEDENGNKTTAYTVNNIDEQLRKMREYHGQIKKLKEQNISDGLLEELTSMNTDDSAQFAKYLSGMSEAEFAKINSLYEEKQALADELSKDLYKDEAQEISDAMTTELAGFAACSYDYGKQSGEQFFAGFNDAVDEVRINALYGQYQAAGTNKIYEDHAAYSNKDGGEISVGVDVTGKSNVYIDKRIIGEVIMEYIGEQKIKTGG